MSSTALERRVESGGGKSTSLQTVLERMRPEIARALPRHLSADRMLRLVRPELRRPPQLAAAPVESLLGALMLAAQLGLEPGPQGHVYLIPRKIKGEPEIVFVIGYRGLIDLAYRSGLVQDISAICVWRGEHFVWAEGTNPRIDHEPDPDADGSEANFRCAYALAHLSTGGTPHVVIGRRQIARARAASAIGAGKGPWATDWEAMVVKTAIRRLAALLPMSPEMRSALVLDEQPAPHMVAGEVLDLDEAAARVEPSVEVVDEQPATAGESAASSAATTQGAAETSEQRRTPPAPETHDEDTSAPAPEADTTGQVEDAAPGGRREAPAGEATSEQTSTDTDDPKRSELAAQFQRVVEDEQAEQMALVGEEAKLVALKAALTALPMADRNDLYGLVVDTGHAPSIVVVGPELILREFPGLVPDVPHLLALRNRLAAESGP